MKNLFKRLFNKVSTHPEELSREAVEKWLRDFIKKLKRKTSRNDLDRLILSVERVEFKGSEPKFPSLNHYDGALWEEFIIEKGKGNLKTGSGHTEEWLINSFQEMILEKNPDFRKRKIHRWELKEETGEWILDKYLQQKVISCGGEAIVLGEKFEELEVAVRVQAFDPGLFVGNEEMEFEIHLSEDYKIARNRENDDAPVIPAHPNVIEHFCNIEIYSTKKKDDCVGWITIMEKLDSDLRSRLKNEDLSLEARKRIAIGVDQGRIYLQEIGIWHCDAKPENILLRNEEPKWIDFGTSEDRTYRKSYRQMGYARRGSKYKKSEYLFAGTAAFSSSFQLCAKVGERGSKLHVFILCDWKTAWSLLFKPIEEEEREKIKEELKSCNAETLSNNGFHYSEVRQLTKVISLENAPSHFSLDDPNLTKSSAMSDLKRKLTKQINFDFKNLTKNVLNQKESNLCVPISVSVLLRWAIKNDLKMDDRKLKEYFSLEKIFTQLTMLIYPRSLAGFNLNPKKEEQQFQANEIELLLRRMKFKTYFNLSGWGYLKEMNLISEPKLKGDFDFEQLLLHRNFVFKRPLTVTGAYLFPDGSLIFHQMVLDRVENSEFILQNTLIDHSGTQVRVSLSREFYAPFHMMVYCKNGQDYIYHGPNNEIIALVNENFNMEKDKWYLLPQAYSITLTPK